MSSEDVLKSYICERYKSVRQFAIENNLKYSTITAMLSRGLLNSSIDTVFEVCKALGIYVEPLVENQCIVEIVTPRKYKIRRRLEVFLFLEKISSYHDEYTIDDILMTKEERDFFLMGMEVIINMIKAKRKAHEEEE